MSRKPQAPSSPPRKREPQGWRLGLDPGFPLFAGTTNSKPRDDGDGPMWRAILSPLLALRTPRRRSAPWNSACSTNFRPSPAAAEREAFEEAFEQIDAAERWGLDTMWLAELHFDPQRSVLSAPLSIAAAVGARTERIKIGIAVQVLPLCHPLRLAEEAATVDHISGGRLIFGVGRSGLPRTYEDYGVSYAESRDRFTEVLDIVELAWSQPGFSYEGKYYNFKNITVAPKPLQKPYPPIRIAAASPDTYPAVGERGLPIFINARYGSFSEFAPEIRAYREAYARGGP